MKRIGALSRMKWRVLLLVLQAGYTADAAIADHEIDEFNFFCAASDGPESVRVERVLTAGQIDSSTVDVGPWLWSSMGRGNDIRSRRRGPSWIR